MNTPRTIPLVLSAMLLACTLAAAGDEKPARPWSNTAEFSAVLTTGNSENTTISASDKFVYGWEQSELAVDFSFLRTETTRFTPTNTTGVVELDEDTETTVSNYGLGGTYRHTIRDGFLWYANAGWSRDRIKGIADRYTGGGGIGYRFLEAEGQTLVGEVGASWTDETRVDDATDSFGDGRGFLGYERSLSESSTFTSELEMLLNLEETDDLRLKSVSSVTAAINSKVALKVSYKIEYDRRPVVVMVAGDPNEDPVPDAAPFEFDATDTVLSASVVINF